MAPLTQGMLIGFFGSALYFAVDKYEPDRTVAFMLKFLVVLWAAAAVLPPVSSVPSLDGKCVMLA